MTDQKIIAAVVLYNPSSTILDNISSYITVVNALVVIDNSSSKNSILIEQLLKTDPKIVYIDNAGNQGIGYALNQAADYAITHGFDWLMTMDQDSFYEDCPAYIDCFKNAKHKEKVAVFAPNIDKVSVDSDCEVKQKELVITSGNLVNLALFNSIGRFEQKLFIDEIDHDYCLKARDLNYEIVQFPHIYLGHTIGEEETLTSLILRKKKKKASHSHQRIYYQTRNRFYMWKRHGKKHPEYFSFWSVFYKVIYKKVFRIIQWEDDKLLKLKAVYCGVRDFLTHKYGAYDA